MTTTAQQIQSIATITAAFERSGHTDRIDIDTHNDTTYVTGYKRAALDRCATVTLTGEIEWVR